MTRPSWLDAVERELTTRGVPCRQRRRLAAEWRDHIHDLTDEGLAMIAIEAKLGDVEDVAAGAAEQYRRSRWARRHPLVAFGLLPGPLVLGGFVGVTVAYILVGLATHVVFSDDLSRGVVVAFAYSLMYALSFVPFVGAAVWYTRFARRTGVAWGWAALALGQVMVAAALIVPMIIDNEVDGKSMLCVATPGLDSLWLAYGWKQLTQVAAAGGAAGLVWWAARPRVVAA